MEAAEESKKDANAEQPMEGVESSQAQEAEAEMTPGKYFFTFLIIHGCL